MQRHLADISFTLNLVQDHGFFICSNYNKSKTALCSSELIHAYYKKGTVVSGLEHRTTSKCTERSLPA